MTNTSNRDKKSKEGLLVNSLEKIKMCKSELRKNIVSLLIENDKLKIQYDTDIRQHRLTIRNLEKNIEKIEKDLEEKNKEVTMLRDEIDSYEIYEPESSDSSDSSDSSNIFISQVNKKIFTEYMLVFIGCILIYSVILNGLVARIIE